VVSFAVSLTFLGWLGPLPPPAAAEDEAGGDGRRERPLAALLAGLRYARGRPELVSSYLVDLAAMTLSYPNALMRLLAADQDHALWCLHLRPRPQRAVEATRTTPTGR
jgi:hypothetical protein